MSQYNWNPQALGQVFMMPSEVADRLLTLASAEQLRVLLWFSRHGQQWDAAACASAVGLPADECEGCLRFWVSQGILNGGAVPSTPAASPAPAEKAPVARAAVVKPVWQEVIQYQKEHREFNAFLQEVSARLGRPLNHGDNATLMYLTTTAGIPSASILMAVGYAVSIGKGSIRYIETLLLNWADEDVITLERVDRKIRQLQETRAAADKVEKVLGLVKPLNAAQAKTAHKWLAVWSFSDAMLQHAQTLTLENCDKFSVAYMDKILERWQAEGINTPDKISAPAPKKKGPASTNPEQSSFDSEELDSQLLKYRPKFNKNS